MSSSPKSEPTSDIILAHLFLCPVQVERSGMASLRKWPEGYSRENWDWYGRRERDRHGGRQTDRQRDLIGSAWIASARVQGHTGDKEAEERIKVWASVGRLEACCIGEQHLGFSFTSFL